MKAPVPEMKVKHETPIWKQLVGGYMGGTAQCLAGQPFDIIKVRLQNQSTKNPIYSSTFDCFRKIVKYEGLSAFYKGTLAPVIGNAFMCSAAFTLNESAKSYLLQGKSELSYKDHYIAGLFAGAGFGLFAGPTENIRIIMQLQKENPIYKGTFDCFKQVTKQHGFFRGVCRGTLATLYRDISLHGIYFSVYNFLKDTFRSADVTPGQEGVGTVLLAGSGCGIATWTINFPLDSIKSAIQGDSYDPKLKKYNGVIDVVKKTLAKEGGVKNFYKGYFPCLLRAAPANAATFLAFEQTMSLLGNESY